jgi:hypothetical protein
MMPRNGRLPRLLQTKRHPILIEFGGQKIELKGDQFKFDRSFLTLLIPWHFGPATSLEIRLHLTKNDSITIVDCYAVVINCTPLRGGRHQLELFAPELKKSQIEELQCWAASSKKSTACRADRSLYRRFSKRLSTSSF